MNKFFGPFQLWTVRVPSRVNLAISLYAWSWRSVSVRFEFSPIIGLEAGVCHNTAHLILLVFGRTFGLRFWAQVPK